WEDEAHRMVSAARDRKGPVVARGRPTCQNRAAVTNRTNFGRPGAQLLLIQGTSGSATWSPTKVRSDHPSTGMGRWDPKRGQHRRDRRWVPSSHAPRSYFRFASKADFGSRHRGPTQ